MHFDGRVPPALSPLDAFAAQGRLLAKQLDDERRKNRGSRLPPSSVAKSLTVVQPHPRGRNQETELDQEQKQGTAEGFFDFPGSGRGPDTDNNNHEDHGNSESKEDSFHKNSHVAGHNISEPLVRPRSQHPTIGGFDLEPEAVPAVPELPDLSNIPFIAPPPKSRARPPGQPVPPPLSRTSSHPQYHIQQLRGQSPSPSKRPPAPSRVSTADDLTLRPPPMPFNFSRPLSRTDSFPNPTQLVRERRPTPLSLRDDPPATSASPRQAETPAPTIPISAPPPNTSMVTSNREELPTPSVDSIGRGSAEIFTDQPSSYVYSSYPLPREQDFIRDSTVFSGLQHNLEWQEHLFPNNQSPFLEGDSFQSAPAVDREIEQHIKPRKNKLEKGKTKAWAKSKRREEQECQPSQEKKQGRKSEDGGRSPDRVPSLDNHHEMSAINSSPHLRPQLEPVTEGVSTERGAGRRPSAPPAPVVSSILNPRPSIAPSRSVSSPTSKPKPSSNDTLQGTIPTLGNAPSARSPAVQRGDTSRSVPALGNLSVEEHLARGIECHQTGQLSKSTYHLRLAAMQEHPTAMLLYALACRHGWGVRPNQTEGVRWLRRAMDSSALPNIDDENLSPPEAQARKTQKAQLALAVYELGMSHMKGWGIDQDKVLGLRCFEMASNWGDVDAMNEAGYCYAEGIGCKRDMKKAARYYRTAEKGGVSMVGNSW